MIRRFNLVVAGLVCTGARCEWPPMTTTTETTTTTPSSTGDTGGSTTEPQGDPTAVGEPVGDPVTATIGPNGGTLTSEDGRLVLTVPPGALAADTELGIQPITNLAWGGIGVAYRLTPSDLVPDSPIEVSFLPTTTDLLGTAESYLQVSIQDAAGYWNPGLDTTRAGGINAALEVLPDLALSAQLRIDPSTTTLSPNGQAALTLENCADLGLDQPSGACVAFEGATSLTWSVEGGDANGTITGAGSTVTYTAPVGLAGLSATVDAEVTVQDRGTETLRMTVALEDRWSGTTRYEGSDLTASTVVTFTATGLYDEAGQSLVRYDPSGTGTLEQLDTLLFPDCTFAPEVEETITATDPHTVGILSIDRVLEVYEAFGLMVWPMTCGYPPFETGVTHGWFGDYEHPMVEVPFDLASGHIAGSAPTPLGEVSWDLVRQ